MPSSLQTKVQPSAQECTQSVVEREEEDWYLLTDAVQLPVLRNTFHCPLTDSKWNIFKRVSKYFSEILSLIRFRARNVYWNVTIIMCVRCLLCTVVVYSTSVKQSVHWVYSSLGRERPPHHNTVTSVGSLLWQSQQHCDVWRWWSGVVLRQFT